MTIESIQRLDRVVDLSIDCTSLQNTPLHRAAHAGITKPLGLHHGQGEEVARNVKMGLLLTIGASRRSPQGSGWSRGRRHASSAPVAPALAFSPLPTPFLPFDLRGRIPASSFLPSFKTAGLRGLLSPVFFFKCGTSQGRRFSVRIFNAQVRAQRDEISGALPGGRASCIPLLIRRALLDAAIAAPPARRGSAPWRDLPVQEIKASVAGILEQAAPLAASAEERLRGVFQRLPVGAD